MEEINPANMVKRGFQGLFLFLGEFRLAGIGLAAIIGLILNPVIPENVKSSEEANN